MKRFLCACLLLTTGFAQADSDAARRVAAYCVLEDYQAACREGGEAFRRNPEDKQLWNAYLQALASAGYDKEMLALYQRYHQKHAVTAEEQRAALEVVAWGVLQKGAKSPALLVRVLSLMASILTQDARGVAILHAQFSDHNALVRHAAVQLALQVRDKKVQDAVVKALHEERHWETRLSAIRAVGGMQIKSARPHLDAILANGRSSAEERAAASEAIVHLTDGATRADIKLLVGSNRAGLRGVGCRIAAHFRVNEAADLMLPLTQDSHAEVRAGAYVALGQMHALSDHAIQVLLRGTTDSDKDVAIAAAWALTRHQPIKGQQQFRLLMEGGSRAQRRKTAAALAGCGACALPLAEELFRKSEDPYVTLNLAIGLIGQRKQTDLALDRMAALVVHNNERWMFHEAGYYRAVMPSKVPHNPAIPQYPEAVNQATRLELLNMLAMLDYPNIQEVMKDYLKQRPWGITGMATAQLLTEGDETALAAVETLLDDPSSRVRIQAAFVLALWGRSEKAIQTLQDSYANANRDEKEKILEGLGRVGDATSIPFLTERLKEPHQSLRIIAATALLQCLYH